MARWNFHQHIAVFYIYLITFLLAEPIVQSPHARRGIFGDLTPVKYDTNGEPIVQDIVKRSEPRLEVSNHIQNQLGEWHNVRSLGGPMAHMSHHTKSMRFFILPSVGAGLMLPSS